MGHDIYTYVSSTTKLPRQKVKEFLIEAICSGNLWDVARKHKLTFMEMHNILNAFNEWTGSVE